MRLRGLYAGVRAQLVRSHTTSLRYDDRLRPKERRVKQQVIVSRLVDNCH
jgi:hypothetical protein